MHSQREFPCIQKTFALSFCKSPKVKSQGEALDWIKPAPRVRGDKLAPAKAGGGRVNIEKEKMQMTKKEQTRRQFLQVAGIGAAASLAGGPPHLLAQTSVGAQVGPATARAFPATARAFAETSAETSWFFRNAKLNK